MSGTKSSSRLAPVKKNGSVRYPTRFLAVEKGKRRYTSKETNSSKACDCVLRSDVWKGVKRVQNTKLPVKKSRSKIRMAKDNRKKGSKTKRGEKVVIVSKRSSSVSVVKSCNLRKSVSVKKVSYSTSVVLSSDEDIDSEEESDEEEKKEYSRKKKTVVKHTTSKVKSRVSRSKITENKAARKAKAIKLLCDKLSAPEKQKGRNSARELRPRFPYTMLNDFPTARAHRMASLNALAKVHVLYENEGRNVGENLNDADECSLIDFLNENSDDEDSELKSKEIKKETKPVFNANIKKNEKVKINDKAKVNDKAKSNDKTKSNDKEKAKIIKKEKTPPPKNVPKKAIKRQAPDIEIIDTRICKRMASLNAQAILAASYMQEPRPRKNPKKNGKNNRSSNFDLMKCDIVIKQEIIDDETEDITLIETQPPKKNENSELNTLSREVNENAEPSISGINTNSLSEISNKNNQPLESEIPIIERNAEERTSSSRKCNIENSVTSATATQSGVTQYTEVTKVQINTHKDTKVVEKGKSERKIEEMLANDDVAITQMYHYQSKSTNESYCVQMQTTYKPGTRNLSPSTSRSSGDGILPYINESILPGSQHYYSRSSILPSQAYPVNATMGPVPPIGGMDHRLPHQFGGSAFTVPHYRHPQPMQFPPNDYGYFQPAGPLIQPSQDQLTIHKPVPYHPQPNPHQPPMRPQQPSPQREGFQSFESRHSQQKPALTSRPSVSSQQKPSTSTGPPTTENLPQSGPSSPQFTRRQPADDARSRSLSNSSTSFTQPSKHVRSPVMPTLYSSQQNFRTYQTQKRVPSTLKNYHSYERKDHFSKKGYDSSSFNNYSSNMSNKVTSLESHQSQSSVVQPKNDTAHVSRTGNHYKNNADNLKEINFGFKHNQETPANIYHCGATSSRNSSAGSASLCNSGASSSMYNPSTSSNIYNPNTSSRMCQPSTSSNTIFPNSSSMDRTNSSSNLQHHNSSEMHNSSLYSNMCNTDPSSNMYNSLNIHHSNSSSNFLSYHHIAEKDVHHTTRPPTLIDISEDNHRDTKTYIQLEVPKNSHREKIVVVDVEDDEIEKKHIQFRSDDKTKPSSDKPQKIESQKAEPEKKNILSTIDNAKQTSDHSHDKVTPKEEEKMETVKKEKTEMAKTIKKEKEIKIVKKEKTSKETINIESLPSTSTGIDHIQEKNKKIKTESPKIITPKRKKKKKSAVVRRAKLNGKQRRFRDWFNRPLAPFSENRNNEDDSTAPENQLTTRNLQPLVSLPRLVLPRVERPRPHGWAWQGTPRDIKVYVSNDRPPCVRRCYPSMKHIQGDRIRVRDCVYLRSSIKRTNMPFVAKVTALWENPSDGEMTMSLLWYYRPEQIRADRRIPCHPNEIFASKHRDVNSVACIEDKCYVLTYSEFCRFKKICFGSTDEAKEIISAVPKGRGYPRRCRLPPPHIASELVMFSYRVYDYRKGVMLTNPM